MTQHRIIVAHTLDGLRSLEAGSVQCCVTSPPYWGLRDYGLPPVVWDGQEGCEHQWGPLGPAHHPGQVEQTKWKNAEAAGKGQTAGSGAFCSLCGAWRGQLGLEPSIDLFIQHLVQVFREVRRVLRDDGTCWINMGDGYNSNPSWGRGRTTMEGRPQDAIPNKPGGGWLAHAKTSELKSKDLIGQPWRLAFALQQDGWWLRADIIWHKPAPMPESVTDRPTKSHEYVFLLTKSARYFYDAEAVKEAVSPVSLARVEYGWDCDQPSAKAGSGGVYTEKMGTRFCNPSGRNLRDVWTVCSEPTGFAHFAAFPRALVRPCIRAGTSERGACPKCGAPWVRAIEKTGGTTGTSWHDHGADLQAGMHQVAQSLGSARSGSGDGYRVRTLGWRPGCECNAGEPVPCVILDPFAGTGTVGVVAKEEFRDSIGIELNPKYAEYAEARIRAAKEGQADAERVNGAALPLLEERCYNRAYLRAWKQRRKSESEV